MRCKFLILGCLSLLALSLFLGTPLYAQSLAAGQQTGPDGMEGGRAERRELREERQRLRAEHEALEAEGDRLTVQCMNVKGQERSACEDKKHALKDQKDDLHRRLKVFHEKVEAEHREHHPNKPKRGGADGKGPVPVGTAAPAHP